MATSVYNRQRRKKLRADKRADRRRMRHTQGDWKFDLSSRLRPNKQRKTWDDR